MSDKTLSKNRQEAIKELLNKEMISDQKRLAELLQDHYKIETNQTVVSRDLRKLGVIKKQINGSMVYEMPTIDLTIEILKLGVVDILHNESMIVIKTRPGITDFVGDCLDQYTELDVLGCLAGENVIFVVPKSVKKISKTYASICEKFHFKNKSQKEKKK